MDKKYHNELKRLGLKIAYYRKLNGFSQEELAEKADISRTHMSRIETAQCTPSLITLINISTQLNISLKDLFDY